MHPPRYEFFTSRRSVTKVERASVRDDPAPTWVVVAPGVRTRLLIEGDGTAIMIYEIGPGVRLETHSHEFPEFGVMMSGEADMDLDGEVRRIREGDAYYTPAGCRHGMTVPPGGPPAAVLDVSITRNPTNRSVTPFLLRQARSVVKATATADSPAESARAAPSPPSPATAPRPP